MKASENKLEKRTISLGKLFAYAGGGMFTYAFQLNITNYYILFFMTDVIAIPTFLAATLNSVIQWIEVGTMPLSGILIDKVNMRWGKYGSWILIAGITMGITLPLVYFDYNLSTAAMSVIIMIMYFIMAFAYNVGWTATRALAGSLSKNSTDTVMLSAASSIGGSVPGIFWSSISAFLFGIPLWANTSNMYAGASLIIGALIIAGAFVLRYISKDVDVVVDSGMKSEKISLVEMIKNLKGPMIPYLISMACAASQGGIFSALLVYYTTYVLKDASLMALSISASSIGSFVGSFVVPAIVPKLGLKKSQMYSQGLLFLLYLLLYVCPSVPMLFVVLRLLQNVLASFYIILLPSMAIDIGDYNEMLGTPQAPAFLQSLGGTGIRIGWAVATALASYVLVSIGYTADANMTLQMINGINNAVIWGPALTALVACVSIMFYKIDENKLQAYRNERNMVSGL